MGNIELIWLISCIRSEGRRSSSFRCQHLPRYSHTHWKTWPLEATNTCGLIGNEFISGSYHVYWHLANNWFCSLLATSSFSTVYYSCTANYNYGGCWVYSRCKFSYSGPISAVFQHSRNMCVCVCVYVCVRVRVCVRVCVLYLINLPCLPNLPNKKSDRQETEQKH